MKIIIIGCGKVGVALAEGLSGEQYDVVLVDTCAEKLQQVTEDLDAMPVVGNGSSIATLSEAGVEDADLLIAVTGSDELNLLCCLIARKQGNCQTGNDFSVFHILLSPSVYRLPLVDRTPRILSSFPAA